MEFGAGCRTELPSKTKALHVCAEQQQVVRKLNMRHLEKVDGEGKLLLLNEFLALARGLL
jgi:hypothetical protein